MTGGIGNTNVPGATKQLRIHYPAIKGAVVRNQH